MVSTLDKRDNGVDVRAESLASLLKVAQPWHESSRSGDTNTPGGYTGNDSRATALCLTSRIVAKSSSDGQKQTRSPRLTYTGYSFR